MEYTKIERSLIKEVQLFSKRSMFSLLNGHFKEKVVAFRRKDAFSDEKGSVPRKKQLLQVKLVPFMIRCN